ncbi:F-actin-monooxygenase MICAL1-like [Sorex fumeus]|uniref:F-actin-monooxygenase MICAL1-like n=1 Tax=Sorex fumeus TaxID=62283 RepID=UPI0024ADB0D5|nr:F-actin-monooxygenase MICAL1-like [Sorex fumeus]
MASPTSTNPAHAHFESFLQAQLCQDVLSSFQELCRTLGLEPGGGLSLYYKIKAQLNNWNAKSLWDKLDKRAGHPVYQQGQSCVHTKCLVVGAGPCGLRAAVELALLGARVVVVEKCHKFSRHNVLHLWPFTIHDLQGLGAKKFYGRFCTGNLDHISTRQLQLILLKVALLLGVDFHWGVTFTGLQPPTQKGSGWRTQLQPSPPAQLANYEFDVLISAAGGKFVSEGFTVREMRGKLAIGITANFVNRRTVEETQVSEMNGMAKIYNQNFFQSLFKTTGIDLENIVYYKDDTHYFMMTAKKQSLLRRGVLLQDFPETKQLLSRDNVVPEALQRFSWDAANLTTKGNLGNLEFAVDAHGKPDISVFDFTTMMRAESAARVQEKYGARLLLGLVGDCLVEPFWPLGTGVARGFLAALDAAWMVKHWAEGAEPLKVLAERKSLYQLLSQTSPENMHRNTAQYGLDPATRYPNLNLRAVTLNQVRDLYNVVDKEPVQPLRDRMDLVASVGMVDTQKELLRWCQEQTTGFPGVHVTDLSSSWADGRALCALVHRVQPDLLKPSVLQGRGALEAASWALRVAEHELGIAPVLSAWAVVMGSDPLGLIAYLSSFHSAYKSLPHMPGPSRQFTQGTSRAVLFLGKLQRTLQRTRAQENGEEAGGKKPRLQGNAASPSAEEPPVTGPSVPLTPPAQQQEAEAWDVCALCGEQLYILERLCADGHFFHRSCFRCHVCEAMLLPGGYQQHLEDGYLYCLQHLPLPSLQEEGSHTGHESQELPMPGDNSLPPSPSTLRPNPVPDPSQPTRRPLRLSSSEHQQLFTLHFTLDPEMELPSKPPRRCSVPAQQALEGSFKGWGLPAQETQVDAMVTEQEDNASSSDEEEEDAAWNLDMETLLTMTKNSDSSKYPTWHRTLLRRIKEEEMKRFCKAQAIQRRQDEIDAAIKELEAQGMEVELALRRESSSPEKQKTWTELLLQLVQRKNSLLNKEADLTLTMTELKLEEKQWYLDQELFRYMNQEEYLKTDADRQKEAQVLEEKIRVVNERESLIRFLKERRLGELDHS